MLVLGAAPVPSCPSLTAHGSREVSAPAPSRRRPPWTPAASFWFLALAVRRTPPPPFLALTVRHGAVRTAGARSNAEVGMLFLSPFYRRGNRSPAMSQSCPRPQSGKDRGWAATRGILAPTPEPP